MQPLDMGTKKDLTSEQKAIIIYGFQRKDSYRTIATYVGCKKSVVGNVINRFIKTGSTESQTRRTGRPKLLDTRACTTLKKLTSKNRRACAAKLKILFKKGNKLFERTLR